jgi:hypothetical protein
MYRKEEDGGNICSIAVESNSIPNHAIVIFGYSHPNYPKYISVGLDE